MVDTLLDLTARADYVDRKELLRSGKDEETYRQERQERLNVSKTLYIGNLSFYVTEEQIYKMVSPFGDVLEIVMVLNTATKCPCGACFVVYAHRLAAESAHSALQGIRIDDREVSVGWDTGLDPEQRRRWGRGFGGGMVVDSVRPTYDEARGGLGDRKAAASGIGQSVLQNALVEHYWVPSLTDK